MDEKTNRKFANCISIICEFAVNFFLILIEVTNKLSIYRFQNSKFPVLISKFKNVEHSILNKEF